MNTIETLERVQTEAESRSDGDDEYAKLASICHQALCLEGSIQRFGARAAIAQMAELWLDQVTADDVTAGGVLRADTEHMAEELEDFVEQVGRGSDSTYLPNS